MSIEASKLKCSVCHSYLFDDDDIVYCPECGAPHHRDCYNAIGHCGLADKHGTSEQYDFSKNSEVISPDTSNTDEEPKKKCSACGAIYNADEMVCPECHTPDRPHIGRMNIQFDYLGGVPADMDLGEGVTADEAKQFVFANTHRFIPKFASFKLGKKTSANLLAFLFPGEWFLSRKMYKIGAFVCSLEIALSLLIFPFFNALNSIISPEETSYEAIFNAINSNMDKIGKPAVITIIIGTLLTLALKVVCCLFADLFYRNHCIASIKAIKAESEDREEDFRRKGGVNIIMFIVGALAVTYLPEILSTFFM